jgi:hypothetical protein
MESLVQRCSYFQTMLSLNMVEKQTQRMRCYATPVQTLPPNHATTSLLIDLLLWLCRALWCA